MSMTKRDFVEKIAKETGLLQHDVTVGAAITGHAGG